MGTSSAKSQWLSYSGQPTDEWSGGIATFSNGDIATAFSVSKSNGSSSVIVQRLNTSGSVVWSLDVDADYAPGAGSVLVGKDDKVYITGGTKKGASGESGLNDSDIFAASVSATGQKLWYKNYGIGIHEIGSSAVLDGNDNILLEGRVSEVNDGYSFIKNVPDFYGAEFTSGWRGFQLRINPVDGTVSKAYTTGSGNSGGGPIAINRSRNIAFVAGYTFGAVNGVGTVGNGDPAGANTYLIARNENNGAVLWTRMENWMRSNVVAQESENAIYFVDKGNLEKVNGSTGQTIWTKALTNTGYTLSPISGGGVLLSESESSGSLTIRRFDANGTETGTQVVSHTGKLYPRAFIEQGDGIIQISGSTSGTITVQSGTTVVTPRQAGNDSFVLQINSSFSLAPKVTSTVIRGNSLYTIVDGPSWTQAEANSVKLGGHLTAIENSNENTFILSSYSIDGIYQVNPVGRGATANFTESAYWIGLTDQSQESRWNWSNGETSSYRNWLDDTQYGGSGTPNGGTGENYAYIGGYVNGTWDDQPDISPVASLNRGIAEIPLSSSITFSTTPKEGAGVFTTSINLSAGTTSSGNLAEGATVYWKITGITADDLATGALTGSGTITNGKLDLQHSLKTDADTGEKFEVSLFSDAGMTQQIGAQKSETITESSSTSNSPAGKVVARGNSLYTIVDGPSWTQAEANAVKLGGHLTAINDSTEQEFLYRTYQNTSTYDVNTLWIGLTKSNIGWSWSNGEPMSYEKWGPGRPDGGASGANPNHAVLFSAWQGGWDDHDENNIWWTNPRGIAEIPFIQRGDSAYVIVEGPTWEEAEANAQALGGHLVTINDAAEEQFLLNNTQGGWIGYTDRLVEGQWNWVDGTPKGYERWDQNNPSNNNGAEHYAYLDVGAYFGWGAGWNDVVNNSNMRGIAEIKLSALGITSTPTPPTPPTLQSTTASNNQLILTFSDAIQLTGGSFNPAYMTVTVDGQTRKIIASELSSPTSGGNQLTLTLSGFSLLTATKHSISYTPPADANTQGMIKGVNGSTITAFAVNKIDNYSSSRSISKSGISSAYTNLILSGAEPNAGYGNSLNNRLTGNDGNNILDGLSGADTLIGGKGDDVYVIDNVDDAITELAGEGIDTVQASITYTLGETLENLTLLGTAAINGTGNSANNTITGNNAANILNGNGGTDTLIGGRGNDTYIVDSADDTIVEAASITEVDTVQSSISWVLGFSLENLTLTGSSVINGTGNERNNTIIGNAANNILDGGSNGTDLLTGLAGADVFKFSTRPVSFSKTATDHITDFSSAQGDKILISKSALGITASTATLSVVNGDAALNTALSGSAVFIYNSANGELHWNQNGTLRGAGAGGVLAILDNKATLSAGDLVMI